MTSFHIVILGVGSVGKSCITLQYIWEKYIDEYDPTLEDSYRKQVTVDGLEYILEIHDTAGQEEYSAVRNQYISHGDGFVIVYSITLRSSFDEVHGFVNSVLRVKDLDAVPYVLCGNKADLEKERQVLKIEGQRLSETLNCKFYETSARMNHNIKETFIGLIQEIKIWKDQRKKVAQAEATIITTNKKRCILI